VPPLTLGTQNIYFCRISNVIDIVIVMKVVRIFRVYSSHYTEEKQGKRMGQF